MNTQKVFILRKHRDSNGTLTCRYPRQHGGGEVPAHLIPRTLSKRAMEILEQDCDVAVDERGEIPPEWEPD